jgi:iron complex outermembrane recepter protein
MRFCAGSSKLTALAATIAGLLIYAPIISAQTQADSIGKSLPDTSAVFQLGKITVIGKTQHTSFDEISASQITNQNKTDVAKALDLLPGLTAVNIGPRNEANIYIRGFNSLQATMFLDGIPVYVPYDGNIDLARFTTFDVSQISVEKGAVSPMYGPNTMGGVINIITRKPTAPLDLSVETGWKSKDGGLGALNIGSRIGDLYVLGSLSYLNQNKIPLSKDFSPAKFQPSGDRGNSYAEDWKVNAKVGYENAKIGEFSLDVATQNGRKGTPPYAGTDSVSTAGARFWQWPYYNKTNVYSINKINLGSVGYLKIPLYYDRFKNSLFAYDDTTYSTMKKKSNFKSSYDDFSAGGCVEFGTGIIPKDSLKVGIQFKSDNHKESNTTNDTAKASGIKAFIDKPDIRYRDHTVSASIENAYTIFDRLTIVPGASYSRRKADEAQNLIDSSHGTVYKYIVASFPLTTENGYSLQLATFCKLNAANTINASISRRTRFPSIKDRYSYRLGSAIPNANLKPENAVQGELGYLGSPASNLTLQFSGFGTNLFDVIQMVSNAGGSNVSQNQNTGKARFYGYEGGFSYTLFENLPGINRFITSINQSYIHRRNITNPTILFTDVPLYKDVLTFEYAPNTWGSLLWTSEWNSQRYSSTDGKRIAQAFTVENIRAQASCFGFTLNAGVNNLLDANYSLLEGYPELGRNFYVNLTYALKHR